MSKLNPERIEEIFLHSLYDSETEAPNGECPEDAIIVEGITMKVGFHPERVKEHKEEIREMLKDLPELFHKNGGGGWSFLNMCQDSKGTQWTSLHRIMEFLVCLAIANKMGNYCLPPEIWSSLPGGVPYVVFDCEA